MEKRAVISFDLDGTLFDPFGSVHPEDIRLLSTEQPYWFIPATGRQLHSMRVSLGQAGLFQNQKIPLPLILQNGAVIYGPREELLRQDFLDAGVQDELIGRINGSQKVTVLLQSTDAIYPVRVTPFGKECIQKYHFSVEPRLPTGNGVQIIKIMCLCEEKSPLDEVLDKTKDLPLERAFSMDNILEFTAEGVNKGSGLKKLVEKLDLESLPLLAAGDGGNDAAMLEAADISFAPLNSPEEICSQADYVVDTARGGLLTAMIAALGD
jgi:Cof subfamily protein (haloacid dehalogenase superfamily)